MLSKAVKEMAAGQSCHSSMLDEHLLDDFAIFRDQDAFESLVRRHGPLVRGVCRRLLRLTLGKNQITCTAIAS